MRKRNFGMKNEQEEEDGYYPDDYDWDASEWFFDPNWDR